ncbi:MAG: MmcQ/YjbR family DNA-binding protein [Sporocytophaga sp.]|nr:MmcQ/YjbR family DNA-binding protein [Sporocytophaga sp.]
MNIEDFRSYCLAKKGVTEESPFGEETVVYKVMGKMFALADVDLFQSVNLKCDPEEAVLLRESYPAIQPGYHMNKKHWNTVDMDGSLDDKFIRGLIDQSYELVVKGLTKTQKELLTKI